MSKKIVELQQDKNGFDRYYAPEGQPEAGMDEFQYDFKMQEIVAQRGCTYAQAMEYFRHEMQQAEGMLKMKQARATEAREEKFHRDPVERENAVHSMAQKICEKGGDVWQTFTKLIEADVQGMGAEKLARYCGHSAEKICKYIFGR